MPIETFEAKTPRIHPSAFLHPSALLIGDVEVNAEASIWPGCVLRGDAGPLRVGARTSIQDLTVLHATTGKSQTSVGAECTVGHRVVLHGCRIGDRCLVGMGSVVMDNVEIGDDSFVAAGSLVPPGKIFPPRSFILGSPGKRLRDVTDEELAAIAQSWRGYVALVGRYPPRG